MQYDIDGNTIDSWTNYISGPTDVAVDSSGNIYGLSYNNNKIKVFDSSGAFVRQFGTCNAIFATRIDIYNDTIYLLDQAGSVMVISPSGNCIKNKNMGSAWDVRGMAVSNSHVYIGGFGPTYNSFMRVLDRTSLNQVANHINYPTYYSMNGLDVNADGTKLVTVSYYGHKVCIHNISGTSLGACQVVGNTNIGSNWSANGSFQYPFDASFDSSGNIFVVDYGNYRIQKFNSSGTYVSKYGGVLRWGAPFVLPFGVGISPVDDTVYVADHYNDNIYTFDNALSYTGRVGPMLSRMSIAKEVIKKIVQDPELTSGANFGLLEWGSPYPNRLRLRVPIKSNGAARIYTNVDGVRASGGTYLLDAMKYSRKYWNGNLRQGGRRYPSPITAPSCQLNYNIVISDGHWTRHSDAMRITKNMKDVWNVKTFAIGLGIGTGNRSNYESLADEGGTTDALYADSSAELLVALKDAILQAISGTLTFTTPAIMSDVTKDDFIYQSTFTYAKNKQWEGHLKKHRLNGDGSFGAEQWNAATKLNDTNPDSRKIWTINIGTTSTNNFTTSNRSQLKTKLFPLKPSATDAETDNLINFIRGYDSYDTDKDSSTTDERHKLADIYHSDLIVVGKPNASTANTVNSNFTKTDAYYRQHTKPAYDIFKTSTDCGGSCTSRTEVVIAGANSGILHAFDSKDGKELWGYIPPNIIGKLSSIVTVKPNATNPIYGIDESPVVRDIYFDDTPNNSTDDPRWRTILISGLGAGGNGYFALDITDINNPKHLFAIENDTFNKSVKHWNSEENMISYSYSWGNNPPPYLDYSKLGASWSTPRIIRIKINGADRWVAVFGAGYNSGVAPEYGSAIFVMDLENEGRLLKKIDIEDKRNASQVYSFGVLSGVQEFAMGSYGLHAYNYDSQKLIVSGLGAMGYSISQDTSGNTAQNIKIVLEQALPEDTNFVVTLVNKTDIVNSLPADLAVITANGTEKANYDGALIYAPDLEGKITKINLTENFVLNSAKMINKNISTTTLFNTEADTNNGRYIYNSLKATINDDNNLWLYFGTGNTQKLGDRSSNIKNRVYGIKDKDFPNFNNISSPGTVRKCATAPTCPGGYYDLGWFVDLKNSRKVTASPTIYKDLVYFPLYEPTADAVCTQGIAWLNAYDRKCGATKLNVKLGKGVLSEAVVHNSKLYIGLSGEANTTGTDFTSSGNLITGESKATSGQGGVQLEGWKENY